MSTVSNHNHRRLRVALLSLALASASGAVAAQALTPSFTYQGELRLTSGAATGAFDMQFRLFNAANDGAQIGTTVSANNVAVSGGLFSVPLDFGPAQFAGDRQWLEVAIRPAGSGAFETLAPRTEVTAAPYAWSARVALADSVTTTSIVDGTVQGGDLAAAAVGAAQINPAEVQRRVSGTCSGTLGVQSVNADGTVVCGSFSGGGGTVTSIATGAGLAGGPITTTGTISVAPGGIGTTQINATEVQRRVLGSCPAGQYLQIVNQDGTVICGNDAIGTAGWGLTGNTGTNAATNFIGTTDAQPLELRTANARSLRIEPSAESAGMPSLPITNNMIGGSRGNTVTPGVRGATIGGGGVPGGVGDPVFPDGDPNRVTDHFGTVAGGFANRAGDGEGTVGDRAFATVGGGRLNSASGFATTVSGGEANLASGEYGTVSGGRDNWATSYATVAGGQRNAAQAGHSTISGGRNNTANAFRSTIAGGDQNTTNGVNSSIGGGFTNNASGNSSAVGGGARNTTIGASATIAGGSNNEAIGASATIAGGRLNTAAGTSGTVGGGDSNFANGNQATVAGGLNNSAMADGGAIGGGFGNAATGIATTVVGGRNNSAVINAGTAVGGELNCAGGAHSFVAGHRAKARPGASAGAPGAGCADVPSSGDPDGDNGTFVWADSENSDFRSTGPNQFLIRAGNGVAININDPSGNTLRVNGSLRVDLLVPNGPESLCVSSSNQLAKCSSSKRYKRDIADLDLGLATALRLHAVGYRWKDTGMADVGFIAEEIAAIDERLVTRNDRGEIEGVRYDRLTAVLANAVQELAARDSLAAELLAKVEVENAALRAEQARLAAELAELRALVRGAAVER